MKNETVVEYGTALHLVNEENHTVVTEFWGDGSAEAAAKSLKELGKVNWHQFVPLSREK